MIEADIGSKYELILRFFVVSCGALLTTLATGRYEIAVWLIGFMLTNGYYSWRLSRTRAPTSRRDYSILTTLFATSVTLYISCTIYIFMLGGPVFATVAIAALIGQALFNISRHRKSSALLIYDTSVVALAGLFFGLSSMNNIGSGLYEQIVVSVTTIGVCCYYVIAQIRKIQIYEALQKSRLDAAQTQKMRAVGQLTAGVAHEFNNLLTVIRGNVELAQMSSGSGEVSDRLADAMKAADRAHALTSQLLSLSRKARLEATEIDITAFWKSFDVILPRITPATITTTVITQPDIQTLYCDVNQLEVALINLIINARDAMNGPGGILINTRMATNSDHKKLDLDHAKSFCVIEVRDDGPGIPPHLLQQVIEPFFTTKGVGQGTGLGLPMVKGFCEQSGGGFSIESNTDGVKVLLALPVGRS